MARIVSAAGATSVVRDGKEYRPNRQGVFTVSNQVAEALRVHGFEPLGKSKPAPKQSEE